MIINDSYRFSFVHVPKCAGTSVRNALQCLDERKGAYTSRVEYHEDIGLLDYVHIPLFSLRDYFSEDLNKVRGYWSFAIVRDPFSRFPSSVSQHINMYGDQPIHKKSLSQVRSDIERLVEFLAKQPGRNYQLPAEYIHFQKQVDYIFLDGEQVVDTLYSVDEVDCLLDDVSERVGYTLGNSYGENGSLRANRSIVHRNEITRRLVEYTRPVTRLISRALPEAAKNKIRTAVYVPRDERLESLFASDYVKDFIRDYYREDLDLWNEVVQSRAKGREQLA